MNILIGIPKATTKSSLFIGSKDENILENDSINIIPCAIPVFDDDSTLQSLVEYRTAC